MLSETRKRAFYLWVGGLSLLYVTVLANTSISIFVNMAHDDGYYLRFGQLIAAGRWLGPYDQYTLMKGPGYPLFLAIASWLGISITVARALFHCFAVLFFVAVCRHFIKSYIASAFLFALLLWEPVYYTGALRRILREGVYADQILIVLGAMVWMFFGASSTKEKIVYAVISGSFFGWFWLTREESLWAVPGLALFALVALLIAVNQCRWREFLLVVGVMLLSWVAVEGSYRAINLTTYKRFAGVETGERNYKRALSALHSVRSGGTRPFVSVTREARKKIYAISPTFALLEPLIEGPSGDIWASHSCSAMPISCGDVGSGWFAFLLRDVVAEKGGFLSPARAATFFGMIADEVQAACAAGTLVCERHLVAELPNVSWSQLASVPARFWRAIQFILFHEADTPPALSYGEEVQFATALRFLNYPVHTRSALIPTHYVIRGWYYKSGADWFSAAIPSPGAGEYMELQRLSNPGLVQHLNDPEATHQSFAAHVFCFEDCVLRLWGREGSVMEGPLSAFLNKRGSFSVGDGNLYVDFFSATEQVATPRRQVVVAKIRSIAREIHIALGLVVFAVGGITFLVTAALAWRYATNNVCFIVAFFCWMLALSRTMLIVIIDATMMPILGYQYLAPANLLFWSAAVLSCVAAGQCFLPFRWPVKETVRRWRM